MPKIENYPYIRLGVVGSRELCEAYKGAVRNEKIVAILISVPISERKP